jgi:hypothetical protein
MKLRAALGASVLLALAGCGTEATSASRTTSALPTSTAAPVVPGQSLEPPLPTSELDPGSYGWQTVVPELDPETSEPIGFRLAVGTLASEEPAWFEPMEITPWPFEEPANLHPVVDGPAAGRVVHVADDGATSEIRVVDVRGNDLPVSGATPHVIHTIRLSPDGRTAYAVFLDRATGTDLGVFRLAVAGGGSVEQVMPPPMVDRSDAVRLVAIERFVRVLRVSADGSAVARLACGEPFGRCILDVLTVAEGRVRTYDDPPQSGDLVAIGDGVALGGSHCIGDGSRCLTTGVDLFDGTQREYPGEPPAVDADGRLVLLQFPSPTIDTSVFAVSDLDGTDARLVFQTDGTIRPIYQEGIDFQGVRIELPMGWVPIIHARLTAETYETFAAAVRLSDGGWVPIAVPTLYPIGGGHD